MEIPKRYRINPQTGETYSIHCKWVPMNGKNREQILKDILYEFRKMRHLHDENISDLVDQLIHISWQNPGDPEQSKLKTIAEQAQRKLHRLEKARSEKAKREILRDVLRDITFDLNLHIRSYFPQNKNENDNSKD